MQLGLDFGVRADVAEIRARLRDRIGDLQAGPARTPIGQLVKSMISSRTRDPVSLDAYGRLSRAYGGWSAVAAARADDVRALICDVTFPDVKSRHLILALRTIAAGRPDFDLGFLGGWPVPQSLGWLEALPGVGRKVSASVLNFSTLGLPAFVIDSHVLRVLRRFGLASPRADTVAAYQAIMAATAGWRATELAQLHLLLKRLGQTLCRADRACCGPCPLRARCGGARAAVHPERPGPD
jgi:endonuclease III